MPIVPKNPPTKACPACKGTLYKDTGVINEPVALSLPPYTGRASRPAVFYACSSCEHCEEV